MKMSIEPISTEALHHYLAITDLTQSPQATRHQNGV